MFKIVRSFLFLLPPERAHYFTMDVLSFLVRFPLTSWVFPILYPRIEKPVELAGLRFPNRVGLAAGFDKDARYMHVFKALGFGFMEIGTITPLAQPGNDKPRLFRLPKDKALINRLGFNNQGMDVAARRLKKRPEGILIGGNIGKNKLTPNEAAGSDYQKVFSTLFPYVDYFTVNVSSPNTPNLRDLQEKEPLKALLHALMLLNNQQVKPKPIFLKIAPDLNESQLDDIVEIVLETKIHGVVATNTTISRAGLTTSPEKVNAIGAGGLSGAPVLEASTAVLTMLIQKAQGRFPVMGVGGILSAADGQQKLTAGASLLQIYTGFIYRGPALVAELARL
jgi:dihydroorotate dehydrogenase